MNRPTDATRPMASRPLTERIATAIRDGLRGRQAHASDNIVELDAHILKDIGAPSWLISRAVERRDAQPTHVGAAHGWARLVTVAGIAVFAAFLLGPPSADACKIAAPAPLEAVFTGEFERGVPVYRLHQVPGVAIRHLAPARR